MKETEKIYTTKVVGELINNKIVECCVIINDFYNTIENQLAIKKQELINKGYQFKK
jgi:hypothetical protein